MLYRKKLRGTLAHAIAESLDQPVVEQISLLEELALMRGMASEVLVLAEAAIDANAKAKDAAICLAMEVLKQVRDMASAAAQVDRIAKDKVSVHDLNAYVHEMVRAAYETMPDSYARAFEKRVRESLSVNSDSAEKEELNVITALIAQVEAAPEVEI